jgi:hypothetical protein
MKGGGLNVTWPFALGLGQCALERLLENINVGDVELQHKALSQGIKGMLISIIHFI